MVAFKMFDIFGCAIYSRVFFSKKKGPIDLHILHEIKCYLNMAQIEVTINNVIF